MESGCEENQFSSLPFVQAVHVKDVMAQQQEKILSLPLLTNQKLKSKQYFNLLQCFCNLNIFTFYPKKKLQ